MVTHFSQVPPILMVLAATGGLERPLVRALVAARLPLIVANPRQVRDCAKATGQLAKIHRLDAGVLARFAEAGQPVRRPYPEAATEALAALLARRRQVIEMLTTEKNRLSPAPKPMRRWIHAPVPWLTTKLALLDEELDHAIQQRPVWREQEDLLWSAPGIGPVVSRTLLTHLPGLATLTGKPMAALVAVATLTCDSGTLRGSRRVWGGRAPVRAALYRATLVATKCTSGDSQFLSQAAGHRQGAQSGPRGVHAKVPEILNAMMKHCTPWRSVVPQGT